MTFGLCFKQLDWMVISFTEGENGGGKFLEVQREESE